MTTRRAASLSRALGILLLAGLGTASAVAQPEVVPSQQAAMAKLNGLKGLWRGAGWTITDGKKVPETVTQRVGPALDATTMFLETITYQADGSISFHAFNNVVWGAQKSEYLMQARAEGRFNNFPFRVTDSGYVWEIGGGGNGLRYTGTLKDGTWTQISERIAAGKAPEKFAEYTLRKISNTDWPAGGAIKAK